MHVRLGQPEQALAACEAGRRHYPEDTELLFQEGLLRRECGDAAGAEACLLRLLGAREGGHFASIDPGMRSYKARHNLAVLYQEQRRPAEAEAQWKSCLAERPDFTPARLGLAELYLAQGRGDAFEQELSRLGDGPFEVVVLRARAYLARQDFGAARQVLEAAIAQAPEALLPRVVLSHALLQEGTDLSAPERVLPGVLALDPNQKEARHNLAVLLGQQGLALEAVVQ